MPPKLPPPVAYVSVPAAFAPSSWHRMEQCALSVWAADAAVLPESAKAAAGRVLHAARETIWKLGLFGPAATAAVRAVVEDVLVSHERHHGAGLVRALGSRRWLERTLELEQWARSVVRPPYQGRAVPGAFASEDDARDDRFVLGVEEPWRASALRLRGRPDESHLTTSGSVEVCDYKTGRVTGRDGALLPAIETQMRLYLLMAEHLSGRRATGKVHGGEELVVPWDDETRSATVRRVASFGERFPANARFSAGDVATPGSHCVGCGLRPRCATYLAQAPGWWLNSGSHPRPLPFDTWGIATDVVQEELGATVSLDDAGGRRVRVRGLSSDHALTTASVGVPLFMFDLVPTEDTTQHGRRIQPRSFHEKSPGARWPSAWRAQVFQLDRRAPQSSESVS